MAKPSLAHLTPFQPCHNLQTLHLEGIIKFQQLPPNLGDLESLTSLSIFSRIYIRFLPDSLAKLSKLTNLRISRCDDLEELPANFGELENLTHFTLQECSSIESLPSSVAKLSKLTNLHISCCSNLEELPANFGELENLTHFTLEQCGRIKSLPSSVAKLSKLTNLHISWCSDLEELPANFGELENLTHFTLQHCRRIKSLPSSVAKLSKLTNLHISCCSNLEELPANFGELENLTHFTLAKCIRIKSLPISVAKLSKLTNLHISCCYNLEELPANFGELENLTHFTLEQCGRIKSLPSSVAKLSKLTNLRIIWCDALKELPANLGELKSLTHLRIENCPFLEELPANLGKLPQLSALDIQHTGIKCLPSSINKLSKLRLLLLPSRFILETLPYQLDESLIISVEDSHVRKTWKELKKEMEIFSSPTVRGGPSGYLRLTGDPRPWIQNNYTSHSMVRILDLESYFGSVENITESIANLTELTHLHITDRFLIGLPMQLTRITHLSLYNYEFEFDMEFSLDSLGKLSALESLQISSCDTELFHEMDLPVSLRQLTLSLSKHCPAPIPDSMTKLSNLQALHLFGEDFKGAQLDSLPEILNLKKLKLVDCYIKSLPTGLRHVEILHTKGLCFCMFNGFGICFDQLANVETLSVTCRRIKSLPSVAGLHNLQELQLKDCFSLEELPPELDEVVNLCTLNVSGTRIKSLPSSISELPKLRDLILPKCFRPGSLPLKFGSQSIIFSIDDTDDECYKDKDMGYYDFVHKTCSEVDNNTMNTIEQVNEIVSKESGDSIISQQQISPHQLLNQPGVTSVLGDSHGSEANSHNTFSSLQNQGTTMLPSESEQLTADNRLLDLQNPCFPSSQHALHDEHMASMTSEIKRGLPSNFQHDISRGTGNNLLVSENGQNEDIMLGKGYNFRGKDHNPVSHHSIHHLRNQEKERNVEVEDTVCESKGMEDEDCSIISPFSSSQKKALGRRVSDILPDPVFRNYLSCLSPMDCQICINVASCDASVCLYSAPDLTHRITVGEAGCIFPDQWLSDFVLNAYLYDIQLRLSETSSTRLILPSAFQGVTLRYDKRNPYKPSDSIQKWCLETMSSYIPRDLKTIEQVFIPVLDKNVDHWFLLVFIVQTKVVYILDSLGTTPERTNLSISMMRNAKLKLQGNKLYQLFKDSLDFRFEVVETKKQPNCHDCGMYVLKYIECDTIDEMKTTFYSTEDMRVERLKYLAKLVASKHNNNECRKRFMDAPNIDINSESEDKKRKRKRNEITEEEIRNLFGMKEKDAAIVLRVKLSTLKRRCRDLGIKNWPSSRMSRRHCTNKRKASNKSPSKSEYSQHVVECLDGVNKHVLSNHVPDHVPSGHNVVDNSTLVATQQHRDSDQRVQQHLDGTNLGTSSTIVQPNECSRTIVVKATYKDDLVKVYFPLSSGVELLKERIGKKLKLEVDKFKMKYQDEDNDLPLVADISDLEDALRVSESSGSDVVRLCIDEV